MPAKASLWDLLELDPHNGGYGWKSDRGKVLSSLDPKTLREVGNWLDEHATEALDRDEHGRYAEFRCTVGTFAWLGTLPPHDPLFPEQSEEALSFQVEGFYKSSGRRKDVTKVVRLAHLREVHRYYSERDLANALDIPRSTVGDMIRRMEEIGFSLEEFSSVDLEYIAFGAQRGRKGNTGSF